MEADREGDSPAVREFCLITGATAARARYMLEACNSDLQLALNLQLEGGDAGVVPPAPATEDTVRAPDAPREDVLVDSLAAHNMNRGATKRNGNSSGMSVFDPFRDFQVEARRQEEMLVDPRPSRSNLNKIRRLEDLFRPPLEMIFHGSFQMARDFGVSKNKWLMVNPQDSTEFPCQVLNRDIWSDSAIRSIVEEHFVFWQVYADSSEGQQYNQYYRVDRYPYVSVVDPRTGELLKKWHVIEKPFFAEQLLHFLQEHPLPSKNDGVAKSFTRLASHFSEKKQATVTSENEKIFSESAMVPRDDVLPNECNPPFVKDSSAKETLESNKEPQEKPASEGERGEPSSQLDDSFTFDYDSSEGNSTDTVDSSPKCREPTATVQPVCDKSDPQLLTTLSLRFPDSRREIVKFPSISKIKALQSLLESRGYPTSHYQYMTYFPKRTLSSPDVSDATFTTLGIVHNETIFIHACDRDHTA